MIDGEIKGNRPALTSIRPPQARAHTPRAAQRLKAFEVVILRADGTSYRSHILDASCLGARLHTEAPVGPEEVITLVLADRALTAKIVWTRGRIMGTAFTFKLPADSLSRITGA